VTRPAPTDAPPGDPLMGGAPKIARTPRPDRPKGDTPRGVTCVDPRDVSQHPTILIESWAPAALIPMKMPIASDREPIIHDPAERKQQEAEVFRLFWSDELSIRCSFSQDLPDLLEIQSHAPLLFVRRVYDNQHHQLPLAQERWSRADQELLAGRLLLSEPDPFQVAAVRIREIAHWSKPLLSQEKLLSPTSRYAKPAR
jgi:hypothetical protein